MMWTLQLNLQPQLKQIEGVDAALSSSSQDVCVNVKADPEDY